MIFLWIALGVVALVAATQVVGRFLPERFEGRAAADYDSTPEQVWEALQDVDRHPMTGKMKRGIERLPNEEGRPCWIEDMGRSERITVKTVEAAPPARLVRAMTSATVDMSSRWEYALEPREGGCRLALSGVTHIRGGGALARTFRFMMRAGGGVRKGLATHMEMLAETLGDRARFVA